MHKRKLVTLTLFLSTLALSPLIANTDRSVHSITVSFAELEHDTFQERIASYLEEKGLEAEAAQRISKKLTAEEGSMFDKKVLNLLSHCSQLSEKELVAYALDKFSQLKNKLTLL